MTDTAAPAPQPRRARGAAESLASIVLALTVPIQWIWTAGAIYSIQGPVHWRNGVLIERARSKVLGAAAGVVETTPSH